MGYSKSHEWNIFIKRGSMVFLSSRHDGADVVSFHVVDEKMGQGMWYVVFV